MKITLPKEVEPAEVVKEFTEQVVENNPNAGLLTVALRSLGYDNLSAIADITDNSIDAEATIIKLQIDKAEDSFELRIADNGYGMSPEVLDQALRLGSDVSRDIGIELGKFGMGLSTASLAIGRRVEVLTKTADGNGITYKSVSDVDEVVGANRFVKTIGIATEQDREVFKQLLGDSTSGTVVILKKCDNIKNSSLKPFVNSVRNELSRIFRRFIQSGLKIYINDEVCEAIDPLMLDQPGAEVFSDDTYPVTIKGKDGKEFTEELRIRIAILPDFGAEGNRIRKINFENQGFYVMRNNREVVAGKTLNLYTKHPAMNRFRTEIYFNANIDEHMGVNFTKKHLDITQSIHDKLEMYLASQIRTIRRRLEKVNVTAESSEVTHDESQRIISQKSKLLLTPKSEREVRGKRTGESDRDRTRGEGTKDRSKFKEKTEVQTDTKVRFEAEHGGRTGHIYETFMEGRTIIIRWNIDHPFYERFVLSNKDNKTMSTSVDFLVYSLATAELSTVSEENYSMVENIKTVMASNLRTLLD